MKDPKKPYWFNDAELSLLTVAVRLRLDDAKENEEADGPEWVNKWKKLLRRIGG